MWNVFFSVETLCMCASVQSLTETHSSCSLDSEDIYNCCYIYNIYNKYTYYVLSAARIKDWYMHMVHRSFFFFPKESISEFKHKLLKLHFKSASQYFTWCPMTFHSTSSGPWPGTINQSPTPLTKYQFFMRSKKAFTAKIHKCFLLGFIFFIDWMKLI